jgi:raffinose/stachyose/melibiose transport system substrate-binding protein
VNEINTTRRNFLRLVGLGVPVGAALAACGGAGPGEGGDADAASYWFLSGEPQQSIREASVERFNKANPGSTIKITEFQNDAYKPKIKTALGAGKGPTMIWGWGGGGLKSYVDAGQVVELDSFFADNPELKEKTFPSAFGAATIDGTTYAMPVETVTPIVFYYNKRVFEKVGADVPQEWGDVYDLIPKFTKAGIAPFSLAGQPKWTSMMWLEFFFDRIGGPEVFQAIFDGEPDAWSNPAAIQALTETQKLIKAGGFVEGFNSIAPDSNADQALLYTDRAAMMVHGAWTYGGMRDDGGDFVTGGNLGWMNFPPVAGGKGDPADTVGNPAQYISISSKASKEDQATAKKYLATLLDDDVNQGWIDSGSVPVVTGTQDKLTGDNAEWLNFIYDTSANAPVFAQSWDQALPAEAASTLLDNIGELFALTLSPQGFADNMNKVIGS